MKFSSTHGQNILLTNSSTTATWSSKLSGGWAFSVDPLKQGQTVVVQLDGSGHCDLGFIKEDPKCTNMVKQTPAFKQMNEIRIHKRTCVIPVTLNDSGTEVSSRFQDKTFGKSVDKDTKLWLTIYIKFGKMSARILLNGSPDNAIMFSDNHGANINLEENNFVATTVLANPAATCFVKDKLSVGEEIVFQCSPIIEEDREPSRYSLKLLVYERNPESLKKEYKFLFDSGSHFVKGSPVTSIELLEKENCKGEIAVALINETTVGYRAATHKFNEQRLNVKATEGIWIILELFRTTVTADRRPEESKACNVANVMDSVLREPSNIYAENSMEPIASFMEKTEVKRQFSDYMEVSDATPHEADLRERLLVLERGQEQLQASVERLTSVLVSGNTPACNSNQARAFTGNSFSSLLPLPKSRQDRRINVRQNFTLLIKDLHSMTLCDKLYEKEIITQNEYHEITADMPSPDRNRKLLLTIERKNIMKSTMDTILDDTEQGHLKTMF